MRSAKGTIFKESGNGYFNVELDEPAEHSVCAVHLKTNYPQDSVACRSKSL